MHRMRSSLRKMLKNPRRDDFAVRSMYQGQRVTLELLVTGISLGLRWLHGGPRDGRVLMAHADTIFNSRRQ